MLEFKPIPIGHENFKDIIDKNLYYVDKTFCLRISKESIFTGLNNLKVNSIMIVDYSEYFGFTENEVKEMLESYDLSCRFDDVK